MKYRYPDGTTCTRCDAADATHQCDQCGEPTCSTCMDGQVARCIDCQEDGDRTRYDEQMAAESAEDPDGDE